MVFYKSSSISVHVIGLWYVLLYVETQSELLE